MGANGSHASGVLESTENREYYTLFSIGDNIKFLEMQANGRGGKLPEESHTPNRIYVSFYKDGKNVKEIAEYDENGKKKYSIHTHDHYGLSPHFHYRKEGRQDKEGHPLTSDMQKLYKQIINYGTF